MGELYLDRSCRMCGSIKRDSRHTTTAAECWHVREGHTNQCDDHHAFVAFPIAIRLRSKIARLIAPKRRTAR